MHVLAAASFLDRNPQAVLSAILPQLSPRRDSPQICGLQDAAALEADDCRLATNPHDIITIGVGSVVTELYATKAYFLTGLPNSEEE
jgi:hypothetical protein